MSEHRDASPPSGDAPGRRSVGARPADRPVTDRAGAGRARTDRPEPEWERKRRLARIFGEVLPETTSDERGEPDASERGSDAWLRSQVPPHHGG